MKGFWALPTLLRLAVAGKHSFSVTDDILAFPQFEIRYSQDFILEDKARALLSGTTSHTIAPTPDSESTALQKQDPEALWPFPQGPHSRDHDDATYETLLKDNRRFLCRVPTVSPSGQDKKQNVSRTPREERQELERVNVRGWELLTRMRGQCIYYYAGWWTYRYCFGQGVKQFHAMHPQPGMALHPPVEDPNVEAFMLGNVAEVKDTGLEKRTMFGDVAAIAGPETGAAQRAGVKYLVQHLRGGTECDLTGRERRIEVQFHCSQAQDDHVELIKETSTCVYLMIIKTPKLCDDVAFLPPSRDDPNYISCAPVLAPDQVPAYKASLTNTPRPSIPNPFLSPPLPRVGNIQVGAHAYIPEGREIKKSSIAGGTAGETVVDTIASSAGIFHSVEELEKLGIKKPEYVEKLRKELDRIAGDQGWKLEIVDTPRGREYRGVIGDGDEEGQGQGGEREVRHNPARMRGLEKRAEYEKAKWEAGKAAKGNKKKDEEEQGEPEEKAEEVGSVEEMQEEDAPVEEAGDKEQVRETEAEAKPKDRGIKGKKEEIMKQLMEQEGAEELVMVWDDGEGELLVDRRARDEL
ncbi:hypothetical protein K461DRAFT_233718 [Myriangium duriaei CBS 260.36]|uniref:Endoplasmic reticulum lectin n=1 Tax=Myriangium duriaei CBS 260.36 TaxID=1168546 RepID=A0A9P4IVS8_9PEZI|nr:hypothetical protein K461DRAFT_233718 [Myriangium duriaei CBS 260.36]